MAKQNRTKMEQAVLTSPADIVEDYLTRSSSNHFGLSIPFIADKTGLSQTERTVSLVLIRDDAHRSIAIAVHHDIAVHDAIVVQRSGWTSWRIVADRKRGNAGSR